jgi:hypothetical protein
MNTETHNGWSNYETWVTKLWMDNEEATYQYWQEVAQQIYADAQPTLSFNKVEQAILDLSEALKGEHQDRAHDLIERSEFGPACVFSDLLNAALCDVNWYEIAESMISEFAEEEKSNVTKS